jgi:hypothetical protein
MKSFLIIRDAGELKERVENIRVIENIELQE